MDIEVEDVVKDTKPGLPWGPPLNPQHLSPRQTWQNVVNPLLGFTHKTFNEQVFYLDAFENKKGHKLSLNWVKADKVSTSCLKLDNTLL